MTIGDEIRKIRKESLQREINQLKMSVAEILRNDGDANENDLKIRAYREVITQKEQEYERM